MAKKKTPGLVRRGRIWHFDKTIDGRRIQGSTGTRCLDEAEAVLSHILTTHHRAKFYGIRPRRLFREAATKYLQEETKKSLHNDAQALRALGEFAGLDIYSAQHEQLSRLAAARGSCTSPQAPVAATSAWPPATMHNAWRISAMPRARPDFTARHCSRQRGARGSKTRIMLGKPIRRRDNSALRTSLAAVSRRAQG